MESITVFYRVRSLTGTVFTTDLPSCHSFDDAVNYLVRICRAGLPDDYLCDYVFDKYGHFCFWCSSSDMWHKAGFVRSYKIDTVYVNDISGEEVKL